MRPDGRSPFLRNILATSILALWVFASPWIVAAEQLKVIPFANWECDSLMSSLQANDIEEANRLVRTLVGGLRQNPSIRTPWEDLLPSKAEFLGDTRETAATACSTIRGALAANDPSKAYAAGVRLSMILERSVAALPSSPQAKFARME